MIKVIVTAEVEDIAKWEEGFKTHGDVFRAQGVSSPIHYSTDEASNRVVICFEVADLDNYLAAMDSPETAEAMAYDGVKRETVALVSLDRECAF